MRFLLLTAFFLLALSAGATNYYFSSAAGDDTRSALEAQSPETPWKSIDKLNAYSLSVRPGDSVLFRRGDTFYGTITIRAKGGMGQNIYFGAYGTGANPVISGFVPLTDWTSLGNGLYSAPLDVASTNIITINGEANGMGRWPNSGYLTYEKNTGNSSITDNELPASPDWTGAEAVIRKNRFILDRNTITSQAGTTLNYSRSTTNGNNAAYNPANGNGYFIQNHILTLDQFGEWYFDQTNRRLVVYFGSKAPSNYMVKAATKDYNIIVSTNYFLTFENLDFEGANQRGVYLINISNSLVKNCNFYNQGGTALYGIDLNAVTVSGGSISNSFSNGILFEYNANNCTVDGVSVTNTNTIHGSGRSGNGVGIGIMVYGDYATITNNRVVNSGYNGIQFIGNNVLVERNYVDNFCTQKDDGGGIYTYTGSAATTNSNRVIRNNIVVNAVGARDGAGAYPWEPFGKAAGIYLDDFANNVNVSGNAIAHGDWAGIFLHNAHTSSVRNNVFFNHRYQFHISQYATATRNNTVTDNQGIARDSGQLAMYYQSYVQDLPSAMGVFNYNYYARPADDNKTFQVEIGNATNVTLAQWKTTYRQDSNSQPSPITYKARSKDSIRFEYNASTLPKVITLDGVYLDVKNTQYTGPITLEPFTSIVLLKSSALTKLAQTIQFADIADKTDSDAPFLLSAAASSGLKVTCRVLSGPATLKSDTVTITGAGTVVMEAAQSGDATYYAANVVTKQFMVARNPANPPAEKGDQTISFGAIADISWSSAPFALTATASSGLPVSYRVVSGPAIVANGILNIVGAGLVVVEASQAGNEAYHVAAPVVQQFNVLQLYQTITFGALPDKTYKNPPFTIKGIVNSELPVLYRVVSGPAVLSDNLVTLTGAGTVTIEASQPGDEVRRAAVPVIQSFSVAKAAQAITVENTGDKVFGNAPFAINATASSGLPVQLRLVSGPATITGNVLTLTGAGTVMVEASQEGNTNYTAAAPVLQSIAVSRAAQAITFNQPADKSFGDEPSVLSASTPGGLAVSFRVISGPAAVTDSILTITGAGDVVVEASQGGDANYNAAAPVTRTIHVGKAAQTLSFNALADKTFGDAQFPLHATVSSGLLPSYRVVSGPATITGNVLTLTGAGTVVIEASQTGNENYSAATPVTQTLNILVAAQNISFGALSDKSFGDAPFNLSALASSGLPLSYRVVSGPVSITGSLVTINSTGDVIVEAYQDGNQNFTAAAPVQQSFTVNKGVQIIRFPAPSKNFGDPPFVLGARSSAGLPVSYRLLSGPATLTDSTLTITGVGEVSVEASQVGNGNYNAAVPVTQSFAAGKAAQTIQFPVVADKTFGDAPFVLAASASSVLPVGFTIISGPATITGSTLTITGAGDISVAASQGGNANYLAAEPVTRVIKVRKASQTISVDRIGDASYGDAPVTVSANASSNLPVTYTVVSGPATLFGNQLTITGAGDVVIEAAQDGDANFDAATPVQKTVSVAKAAQVIAFDTINNKTFGDAPFALSAISSAGLLVEYRIVSGPATIAAGLVSITGAGEVVVEAAQSGNNNYVAAAPVQKRFTVSKASQAVTFGALADKSFGDVPFTLNAGSTSSLPVSFRVVSGPASVGGNKVTLTGAGDVTIEATQGGDERYFAAAPVQQTFVVAKGSQAINFAPLSEKVYGDAPFPLTAIASSGLPVSFTIVSGTATVAGNLVSVNGTGEVTIEATQSGNGNYQQATAVRQSFLVKEKAQHIVFPPLSDKTYGAAGFTLVATASSGLSVNYNVVAGPATVSGNQLAITGAGTITIEATQAGNENYTPAKPETQTFTVFKAAQSISFAPLPGKTFGDAPFQLSATASSGLPVAFRIVSGAATLNDNVLTITGAGSIMVEAMQLGNDNYNIADPVARSFTVSAASQAITFAPLPAKTFGDAPFTLMASASSNLPVSFTIVSGPATVSGNQVAINGVGDVIIKAQQAGNENYLAAPPVQQSFAVIAQGQVITFTPLANKTFGEAPFALAASASSGLPVSYRIVSGPAMVAGNVLTSTGAGDVTVEASQAGNENIGAAIPVTRSFAVSKAAQALSFEPIGGKTFGDASFQLAATASSGLPVSYRVVSGPVSLSGNTVTITGAGEAVIEASQSGNANFLSATPIQRNFSIGKAGQAITFNALQNKTFGDAPFLLNATASSGLAVGYRIVSGPATITDNVVAINGTGTVLVEAVQAGNVNFNAAAPVQQSFAVNKAAQTITFPAISAKVYGATPFPLNATASSGLGIDYRIVSGPATVSGNTVTLTGIGTVVVEASQAGNTGYNPAMPVQQSFTVASATKQAQAITFGSLAYKFYNSPPFELTATASSRLPVSYRLVSGPATISGSVVTITGVGTVYVEASQAGDLSYNAATPVQRSFAVGKASQTITFNAPPNKTFGDPPFALAATASSGLTVLYRVVSGSATVSGNMVTLTGTGTVTIEASQPGDANYAAAYSPQRSFTVSASTGTVKQAQTITFGPLANKNYGDPAFALSASASSGLPVTLSVVSGPATISGNTVTLTGTGTVTIEASQAGNTTYNAAAPVQQSFTAAKAAQAITFGALPNKTFGDAPFTVSATASSGLPVSFRIVSGPATVSGNTVTLTGTGTVIVEASQAGNSNYNAATPVQQSFVVSSASVVKQNQAITFNPLSNKTYGDAPFALSATASSGLSVSYSIVSGPATVSGNLLSINGAGAVNIQASQTGDAAYNAATPVQQSLTVAKAGQSIAFAAPPNKTVGDAPSVINATATSGLPVSFQVISGPATVSGNMVTVTAGGTVVMEASQTGNGNYNAAAAVQQSFTVAKAAQVISFPVIGGRTYGDAPFALTASASSGLLVSYRLVSGPATVSGNTVTITGAGTVVMEASQAGNNAYNAAAAVQQSFSISKGSQTITFGPLANKTVGDAPFTISATASAALPVSFRVVSGPATISGNTVTLTGSGTVTIEASQAGDANYNAATPVTQSFTVLSSGTVKQSQTITFGSLAYKTYTSAPFELTATASSGLPVSYRIVSGPATVSGNIVTITGVGLVYVEASQAGNATFNAATPVTKSFQVGKAGQTITFNAPPNKTFGDTPFALAATASSGLTVLYRVVSGPATVSGNMVTLTGTGTVTIEASQPGDANYAAAYSPQRSFTVSAKAAVTTMTNGSGVDRVITESALSLSHLLLYPNPVYRQGVVRIALSQSASGFVFVYDLRGKVVKQLGHHTFEKNRSQVIDLNAGDLSSGTYILRFHGKDKVLSQTFEVMK